MPEKSWMIFLAVVGVSCVSLWKQRQDIIRVGEQSQDQDGRRYTYIKEGAQNQAGETVTTVIRKFPWESESADNPVPAAHNTTAYTSKASSSTSIIHQQQKQLELLATMTFANGGFRGPSCPCCK
jgi:hypothetical protein